MRFVLVSDTHCTHERLDMPEGDVLLHAGDFTNSGNIQEISFFNEWLKKLDYKHKIVIPGNHELLFETDYFMASSILTEAIVLNQTSVMLDGIKIYGEPRQPRFFDWAFNVDRDRLADVWTLAPEDADVVLTHGPPYRCGDFSEYQQENVGCYHQRAWIEKNQPKLVVCGHIHPGYGKYKIGNTDVINAAIMPNNDPIIYDID